MDRWTIEDLARFDFGGGGDARNGGASGSGITNKTEHDFGAGLVSDDVGGAAAGDGADIQRRRPEDGIGRQVESADFLEGVEQRMNCGMAEMRISGVGQLTVRDEFIAEGAFGAKSKMIFGGFAINKEARATGRRGGGHGTDAAALFTDDEEEREIACATSEKRFGGGDHGGDDPLGVAGAAAVDVRRVFAGGEERRNGVHVGGESDVGIAKGEAEIVAARLGGLAIETRVVLRRERREVREEVVRHRLFLACGGVDVHQRAG